MNSKSLILLLFVFLSLFNPAINAQDTDKYLSDTITMKLKDKLSSPVLNLPVSSEILFKADSSGASLMQLSLFEKKIKNKPHLNYIKFGALTGFTAGAVLFLHNFQKHAWWSGDRGKFHVENDWAYAMSMDKLGHFMVGGLISKTMRGAFIWSGMKERTAMWFGALFSIAYMTDIEIEDGFAKEWGYSPGDEYSNLAGDIFSIAQDLWKPLQTVNMKWSYVPTNDPAHKGDFPDDYSGQVFWLSFDVHHYLTGTKLQSWPDFLNLALGYGVKDYDHYGPGARQQNIYLGLDLDLRKIIPGESSFMRFVKEFLNTFKIIPTPAMKWNTSTGKFNFVVR